MSITYLYKKLTCSVFLRSIFAISSGTAVSQLLLVLFTPILTRLYSPADFGVFAVFTSLLSISVIASSLRFEIAIPLPRLDKHAKYIVILSVVINVIVCAGCILLVTLYADELSLYTKTPLLKSILWLLPIGILCLGIYRIFNFWAIRKHNFKNIGKTKVLQSVFSIIVQLVAGLSSFGAIGLVVGRMIGQSAGALSLAKDFEFRDTLFSARYLFLKLISIATKYKNFFKYDVAASIINTLNLQLPQILIAAIFGPIVTGHYMLVDRVLAMPASLIGQAVGQVFYGNWDKALTSGIIYERICQISKTLTAMVLLPAICIFYKGSALFPLLFGQRWSESGLFATWIILGASAQFVYSPISMALMATNGQRVNLIINLVSLSLKISGCIVGYQLKDVLLTVQIISISNLIVYSSGVLVIIRRVKNLTDPASIK